ncbi:MULTISPECIES: hypothetical protein [unclassified Rhodococcus (in: high G+C Gram-positive bacteria)]|nr:MULTISPECIES: hypothetical protein [unclassified Rhodococcus (in: high G+C Gram-positive bacteria)]
MTDDELAMAGAGVPAWLRDVDDDPDHDYDLHRDQLLGHDQ